MKPLLPCLLVLTLSLAPATRAASLFDLFGFGKKKAALPAAVDAVAALTPEETVAGLKAALAQGVETAVKSLGKPDGFLQDLQVKIPMPASLQRVESTLRTFGQNQLADEFVTSLNRAAEQAVPAAATVLGESVQQMTLADAKAILTSTNHAATAYFRRTSETNLYARFHPIVQKATAQVGVTRTYKQMTDKIGFAAPFLGAEVPDLDAYVTQKSLDGLFLKVAEEEKRIRENPVARTTDLLQRVFGALRK